MMLDVFYLVLVLIISVCISFEDFRKDLIRNGMLTVLMIIFSVYFFMNLQAFLPVLGMFLPNLLFTFVISLALWFFGFWPAGDAKLFIVLSTMLVPSVLRASASPLYDLLVNIFVPLFFFCFFAVIIKSNRKQIRDSLRQAFDPYRVILIAIVFIGIAWMISLPLKLIGLSNLIASVLLLFVIIEIFYRTSRVNLEYLFVGAALVRLVADYKAVYTLEFLFTTVVTVLVFTVFRFFFLDLAFKVNTRTTKISELRPGMKLAEGIARKSDDSYEKRPIMHFTIYNVLRTGLTERYIHGMGDEGLTAEEVTKIKSLWRSKKLGFESVKTHVSVPFAAFMFLGYFLTVVAGGSFILLLKGLLAA
jgi:hypothetical protein